jgi:hypothetical protein
MRSCWIDGEEYWLYGGHWVPRRHFYDHGEEPVYVGPRRKDDSARSGMVGLLSLIVVGGYVLGKLMGHQ